MDTLNLKIDLKCLSKIIQTLFAQLLLSLESIPMLCCVFLQSQAINFADIYVHVLSSPFRSYVKNRMNYATPF